MKVYRDDFKRMILLIELFAHPKRLGFQTLIRAIELLNEAEKDENVWKHFISVSSVLFQICVM